MPTVRLQKYFTDCGVLSRRAAEEQIKLGRVLVNGKVASLGDSVTPYTDKVEWNGKIIIPLCDERVCVLLNKPRGYVTTMFDERGRKNVSMLVEDVGVRVYPVGRLDMDSDGLLILTNDGSLANELTHPRHEIPKIYHVKIKGFVSNEQINALSQPMTIDGYRILPVKVTAISRTPEGSVLEMTLFEGRNRQIRKMCEIAGLTVKRLSRVSIGNLKLDGMPVGKWRHLDESEVEYLKRATKNAKG